MTENLEERVRRALDLRARQVTPERLQPARPPTMTSASRSWRPTWQTLLVAATVLVAVVLVAWHPGRDRPDPSRPPATVPSSPAPSISYLPTPSAAVTTPPSTPPGPTAGGTVPTPGVTPPTSGVTNPTPR